MSGLERAEARRLPDGRRLHLHDGPIDLIVEAVGAPGAVEAAYRAAATRFCFVLDELCAELPALRSPASARPRVFASPVARRMEEAVAAHASEAFITPMAAVAGSVADEILAAMRAAADAGLTRLAVNNGGDIALWLAPGEATTVGLVDRPDRPSLFARARLAAGDGIGGIATSGAPGRSFSLGVADAVTILARDRRRSRRRRDHGRERGRSSGRSSHRAAPGPQPSARQRSRRPARDLFRRPARRGFDCGRARKRPRRRGAPGRARIDRRGRAASAGRDPRCRRRRASGCDRARPSRDAKGAHQCLKSRCASA